MTDTPMKGWEREFWNLLSPEATELLKAELTRTPPCPSLRHPSEASAAGPEIQSSVPSGSAVLKPGTRVRMELGWAEHVDGVVQGYRPNGEIIIRWDDEDFDRIGRPRRLSLAPLKSED